MPSVREHYSHHLAPVYSWMMGGIDAALARGESEIQAINAKPQSTGLAVDLGAGFGMHAIPLARRGFQVAAIDLSPELLQELSNQVEGLSITTHASDLLDFPQHLSEPPELVLCMGDTLTHLPDRSAVDTLFQRVKQNLAPRGMFVLSFRDYSTPLEGDRRFIPVRSDHNRIFTCFLEYHEHTILVHDLLHELDESGWKLRVSSYPKLRLAPDWVIQKLTSLGFQVTREQGLGGMVRLVATIG